MIAPEIEHCRSDNSVIFEVIILGIKGLLMVRHLSSFFSPTSLLYHLISTFRIPLILTSKLYSKIN